MTLFNFGYFQANFLNEFQQEEQHIDCNYGSDLAIKNYLIIYFGLFSFDFLLEAMAEFLNCFDFNKVKTDLEIFKNHEKVKHRPNSEDSKIFYIAKPRWWLISSDRRVPISSQMPTLLTEIPFWSSF